MAQFVKLKGNKNENVRVLDQMITFVDGTVTVEEESIANVLRALSAEYQELVSEPDEGAVSEEQETQEPSEVVQSAPKTRKTPTKK